MPGKPFSSKLAAYFEFIKTRRRGRATWAEIAAEITAKGTPTQAHSVYEFYRRHRTRPDAFGMEPEAPRAAAAPTSRAQPRPAPVPELDDLAAPVAASVNPFAPPAATAAKPVEFTPRKSTQRK